MQISDLNNNLLNMIAGKNSQKNASEDNAQFAELLSVVGNLEKESAKEVEPLDVENKLKAEVHSVSAREQDIKDSNHLSKTENEKRTNVRTDNKVEDKSNTEKVSYSENDVEENNEENILAENSESGTNKTQEEISEKEDEAQITPVLMLETENQLNLVSEGVDVDIKITNENVSGIELQEDTVVEAQNLVTKQNNDVNKVEQVVPSKTVANIEVQPELSEQDAILNDEEVIQVQEEKIAELLPEGKKIEIKVNTTKDTVVTKIEKEDSNLLSLSEESEHEVLSDLENSQQTIKLADDKVSEKAEVLPQSNVAYAEANQPLNSAEEMVKPTNLGAEVSPISGAVSEIKAPVDVADKNALKEVYDKGLTREIAEQIKVNITQSAIKGVDKIEIQLNPADLGKIEVKLQIGRDGKLQAHILASNIETLEVMQKDLTSLKEAFNNAGYVAEDDSFSFSYRGEGQENDERQQLREFIGEVITHDIEEEIAANDYISADGVNIRV